LLQVSQISFVHQVFPAIDIPPSNEGVKNQFCNISTENGVKILQPFLSVNFAESSDIFFRFLGISHQPGPPTKHGLNNRLRS